MSQFRKAMGKGWLDWNLLSHGGMSTSFSRQLGQNLAGNSSFSFNLEVSGKLMKRSNLELNFLQENGLKTNIAEVSAQNIATFSHNLSIYFIIAWHFCWRFGLFCQQR